MILVIDNYDSFTFNLFQAVSALSLPMGEEVRVLRNDAASPEQVVDWQLDADFQGRERALFAFDVPDDAFGKHWARFRLDRDEDLSPYGYGRFGEIEDYSIGFVPAPGGTVLFTLAAVTLTRRRR